MTRSILTHAVTLVVMAGLPDLVAQTPAEWQDVMRHLHHPDARVRFDAVHVFG